jgi:hypothetical protein
MEEIEDNAAEILRKPQEGESIEDDFFPFFILLSDAASKRPLDNRIRPNGHAINRSQQTCNGEVRCEYLSLVRALSAVILVADCCRQDVT